MEGREGRREEVGICQISTRWSSGYLLRLPVSHSSHVRLCATPQTAAHQAPPSLGFSRQETGVGCHFLLQCMKVKSESEVRSVVSKSQKPHGLQLPRLLRPWDFPGKSTGVGCHCLLQPVLLMNSKSFSPLQSFQSSRLTYLSMLSASMSGYPTGT